MQLKFLGDATDSFKWDYHDYLTKRLGCSLLHVVLMLNLDDGKGGGTKPEEFPADESVLGFCRHLRDTRDINLLTHLPGHTSKRCDLPKDNGKRYKMVVDCGRAPWLEKGRNGVIFFDPDTGFDPRKRVTKKHIYFKEVESGVDDIFNSMSQNSVVSVLQYGWQGENLLSVYRYIKNRLLTNCHSTAIGWKKKGDVCYTRQAAPTIQISSN